MSSPSGGTRFALVVGSVLFAWALVELGATTWLHRFASDEQFRRFANLEQVRERGERTGELIIMFTPHRFIGFVPTPGFRQGENYHNSLGYRGEEFAREKPSTECRIAALGGSTTYTSFVEDPADSYPAVLQELLRKPARPGLRVINAGALGWTTWETLVNFELRVLDLDPDMIIVYHGINDVLARMVWPTRYYRGDNSGWIQSGGAWYGSPPWWQRLDAVRILAIRSGRLTPPSALGINFGTFPWHARFWEFCTQFQRDTYPSGVFEQASAETMLRTNRPVYFRRNLENLVAIARYRGIVPVLVTFGLTRRIHHCLGAEPIVEAVEEQNQVIREIAAERGVSLFDYATVAPEDEALYGDPVHLNEEGARIKARLFADFLEGSGLLPRAVTGGGS